MPECRAGGQLREGGLRGLFSPEAGKREHTAHEWSPGSRKQVGSMDR